MLAAALAVPIIAGCDESDSSSSTYIVPTAVGVQPEDFLGDVSCSLNEGALQSYVVVLSSFEDAEDMTEFTLGASFPTPCSHRTLFQNVVVAGQLYIAEIDGYDRLAANLAPYAEPASGARLMLDADTEEVVLPRWTTSCFGAENTAAEAIADRITYLTECDPLDESSSSEAVIEFTPVAILGDDPCSEELSFDIRPETAGLPAQLNLTCDMLPVSYEADGGVLYRFYIAVETNEGPKGTQCFAQGKAGQTVTPMCQELSSTGAVSLDLDDLADSGDPICPSGHHFDVSLDSVPLNLVPLQCGEVASIGPLDPTDYSLDVTVFNADHELVRDGISCTAEVLPGKTTAAVCTF